MPESMDRTFFAGILLNLSFVIVEVIAGLWQNSLALLTDAGHNFSDVVSLLFVLLAHKLARLKPTESFTYGYSKTTILVALCNAMLLLVAVGFILWEAVQRFLEPHAIEGKVVSLVAAVGLIINTITALLFFKDKDKDLNAKGAYLHMLSDALVSFGVVVAGVIIVFTDWYWLDAVMSVIISLVILASTVGLIKDSLRLTLDGVPSNVDMAKIKKYFLGIKEIRSFHDLHVWAIGTSETAMTVHLVIPGGASDELISNIRHDLGCEHNIMHTTIQVEQEDNDEACSQKC